MSESVFRRVRRVVRDRTRQAADAGIGMIVVIGTASVVMALVVVSGAIVQRSLDTSREHENFSNAMAAAETGIDMTLARMQAAYDTTAEVYQTPAKANSLVFEPAPDCVGDPIAYDSSKDERTWAKQQLEKIAGLGGGCLRKSPDGEYAVLAPSGRQAVYAMSWVPSRADYLAGNGRARLLKSEYIFSPYKPATAILTGGDLEINASTTVTGATASGNDDAGVHSNGNITVSNGNPTVTGEVSMSGGGTLPNSNKFTGGVAKAPEQSLPTINARTLYNREVGNHLGSWYDLCPDGKARFGATTGPCTGAVIQDMVVNPVPSFQNGWTYAKVNGIATWYGTSTMNSGVYYASEGNVEADGGNNSEVSNATIIASSVGDTSCDKTAGNINWKTVDIATPYVDNLYFLADQDVKFHANIQMGDTDAGDTNTISGMVVAGDQISLDTSSAKVYGSIVAQDACDPNGSLVDKNSVKNAEVRFDPTGYSPFTSIINTTLWLEYPTS